MKQKDSIDQSSNKFLLYDEIDWQHKKTTLALLILNAGSIFLLSFTDISRLALIILIGTMSLVLTFAHLLRPHFAKLHWKILD